MLHLTLSHWPGLGHMFCYWLELLSPSCVTSVWRAARPVGWAEQAADILSGSFPTQQHHTEKTVIRPASHYFFISDVQWLDVGILMLQSFEPSQTKERPRAILGRLQISARPPSRYESGSQCGKWFLKFLFQLWWVVCQWRLLTTSRNQDKSQQVTVLQWHWGWPQQECPTTTRSKVIMIEALVCVLWAA